MKSLRVSQKPIAQGSGGNKAFQSITGSQQQEQECPGRRAWAMWVSDDGALRRRAEEDASKNTKRNKQSLRKAEGRACQESLSRSCKAVMPVGPSQVGLWSRREQCQRVRHHHLYQEWLIIFVYYRLAYFSVASLLINSHKPGQIQEAIVFGQGTPALKRCDPDRLTPTATPFSRTV